MAQVNTGAGGVRKFGEHDVFGTLVKVDGGVQVLISPRLLPFGFDVFRVIALHISCYCTKSPQLTANEYTKLMAKVLILAGGNSSEREVSLRSGAAVAAALQASDHAVTTLDPAEPITNEVLLSFDVIFPLLHGAGGEDGSWQARLEALRLHNYVGSDAIASRLCFDKWHYKDLLKEHHITNPDGAIIFEEPVENHRLAQKPFVLKPYDGGSSVDTFIVRDLATADFKAMNEARARYGEMLIEELIAGTEITVAVFGSQALPVIEIIPPAHEEFDYQNKYNGHTQELCPPEHVTEAIQVKAQELARQLHTLSGCRDYSRTDMIINANDELYVLETNTIPGMTNQSLLPKAAATAGIPMPDLTSRLVMFALARRA